MSSARSSMLYFVGNAIIQNCEKVFEGKMIIPETCIKCKHFKKYSQGKMSFDKLSSYCKKCEKKMKKEINIRKWVIFLKGGAEEVPFIFDSTKEDVDDNELALCIEEQFFKNRK